MTVMLQRSAQISTLRASLAKGIAFQQAKIEVPAPQRVAEMIGRIDMLELEISISLLDKAKCAVFSSEWPALLRALSSRRLKLQCLWQSLRQDWRLPRYQGW